LSLVKSNRHLSVSVSLLQPNHLLILLGRAKQNIEIMTIDLYHHPISAPSHAVRMAVAAFGVDVNLKSVDLFTGEHLKPEFLKINVQHTVPVLVHGDLTLCESRAILQYLANAFANAQTESLYPKDPKKASFG